jgi:hypothetical protein
VPEARLYDMGVASDPALGPAEKEVTLGYSGVADRMWVSSEIPSVTRWLLDHPEFDTEEYRCVDGAVVAVQGTLPVGCLSLKGMARKNDTPSGTLGKLPDSAGGGGGD